MTSSSVPPAGSFASAARIHMGRSAHSNLRKIIDFLEQLERHWKGVRYIREALSQTSASNETGGLSFEVDPNAGFEASLPFDLSEWLVEACDSAGGHVDRKSSSAPRVAGVADE
jgi:hypothetical protein